MELLTAFKTTENHKDFWVNRKIDWQKEYLETWTHPHREFIVQELAHTRWHSCLEIGCASGPNIARIIRSFPGRDLGGIDINPDAIALAKQVFKNAFLEVCSGDDIIMSDKATDLVLTDLTLMYVGPNKIKDYLREIKRVARWKVIMVELYHPSFWQRLKLRITNGYYAHNYPKLLEELGFHQIEIKKLPDVWGGEPQKTYAHMITARTN